MPKKTFWDLYRQYRIEKQELAQEAKVELEIVNRMIENLPVAREDAIKVLSVVSQYVGIRYGLQDVNVKLLS